MPSLRDFCVATASTITAHLLGVQMPMIGNPEFEALVGDLEKEFRESYEKEGKPYGESEDDLVRYLIDNTTFEVEEIQENNNWN